MTCRCIHAAVLVGALSLLAMASCQSWVERAPRITTPPASQANDEQVLMQIEREWADAPAKRDAAALDRIIADDWTSFTWDGETVGKAQVIADAKLGANTAQSQELGPMRVRIFGDTAVVTGSVSGKSQYQGRDMSGHYIWTDVFVKRNGHWQAVASQTTRVNDKP
jgi:ketosteroid isomerase-like protein